MKVAQKYSTNIVRWLIANLTNQENTTIKQYKILCW